VTHGNGLGRYDIMDIRFSERLSYVQGLVKNANYAHHPDTSMVRPLFLQSALSALCRFID
jgi:hypothetical protein